MAKQKTQRPAKRYLVRWTQEMDTALLLGVQHIANKQRFQIPWDEVGRTVDPNISQGAVVQHLAKLRLRKIAEGQPVPPPLRRGSAKNATPSSSRVDANGAVKNPTSRKGASTTASPDAVNDDDDQEEDQFDVDQASDSEGDFGKSPVKRRKVDNAETKTKSVFRSKVAVKKEEGNTEKQILKSKGNDRKGKRASTRLVKATPESARSKPAMRRRPSNVDYASLSGDSGEEEGDQAAEQFVAKNAPFLRLTESGGESSETSNNRGKGKDIMIATAIASRPSKMVTLNVGKSQKAANLAARIKREENVGQGVKELDAKIEEGSDGENEGNGGTQTSGVFEDIYSGADAATTWQGGYANDAYGANSYVAVNHSFSDEAIDVNAQAGHTFDGGYISFPTNQINYAGSQLESAPPPTFPYDSISGSFFDPNGLNDWAYITETDGLPTSFHINNASIDSEMGRPYEHTLANPTHEVQNHRNAITGAIGPTTSPYMGNVGFDITGGHLYVNTPAIPPNEFQLHGNASLPSTTNFQDHTSVPTTPAQRSSAALMYHVTPQYDAASTTSRFASSAETPLFATAAFADQTAPSEDEPQGSWIDDFDRFFKEDDGNGEVEVTTA